MREGVVSKVTSSQRGKDDLKDYLHECIDHVLETINQNDRSITLDFTMRKMSSELGKSNRTLDKTLYMFTCK